MMKQIHFLKAIFYEISAKITLESSPKIAKTFGAQI